MITSVIEALLFASAKSVSLTALKQALSVSDEVLREAILDIERRFNVPSSGIHLQTHEGRVELVTNPDHAEWIANLYKQEAAGELTRPQLEALTIIAYRGPITKPELEQLRGINCSLIVRNLLMRGLIEERDDAKLLQVVYTVSGEFLKHLGLHHMEELPEYEALHADAEMTKLLEQATQHVSVA